MIDRVDRVLRHIGNISATLRRRLLVESDEFGSFEVSLASDLEVVKTGNDSSAAKR